MLRAHKNKTMSYPLKTWLWHEILFLKHKLYDAVQLLNREVSVHRKLTPQQNSNTGIAFMVSTQLQ